MIRHATAIHKPTVPKQHSFRANFIFMGKFLRHGTKIASFWPSSKALSNATVREFDFDKAKVIVEMGAGTGPITEAVLRKLQPHTRFLAIERDPDLVKILRDRFEHISNIEIIEADVRDLDKVLKTRHITRVDYFVSGLGTPSLPAGVSKRMLACVRKYMPEHGVYSNITEVPYYYMRYYKAYFKEVDFQLVPANMPPGGVYHCRAMK